MSEEKVKITVKPNGSIRVEGNFELNYTKAGTDEVTSEEIKAQNHFVVVATLKKNLFAMVHIEKQVFRVNKVRK